MQNGKARYTYLVGAAKSGTTKLADLLDLHPDVSLAKGKEPDTFAINEVNESSLQQYDALFDSTSSVRVDASTSYTETSETVDIANRLFKVDPSAKIIYLVRDPAKRAWSSYWHYIRNGVERGEPLEAISSPTSPHFNGSCYYQQLSAIAEVFPKTQIRVLFFEDFVKNTDDVFQQLLTFLSLSPVDMQQGETEKTKNKSYQWRGAASVLKHVNPAHIQRVTKFLKRVLPGQIIASIKNSATKPVPSLDEKTYAQLNVLFEEDFCKLQSEFADCFLVSQHWKK